MSILIIAPHADDETLGMGGTIAKSIKEGKEVTVAILTGPSNIKHPFIENNYLENIRKESNRALDILGVKNRIYRSLPPVSMANKETWKINSIVNEIIKEVSPRELYVPFPYDLHKDHYVTTYAVNESCRPYLNSNKTLKKVLAYETLSETNLKYLTEQFNPNVFIDISETIDIKLKALACYESQLQKKNLPRTLDVIKALSILRGSHIGTSAAEAFILLGEYIR